jgi:DNA-binding NtrC family response regulator
MKRQKSILILDDEPEIANYLQDLLSPIYEEVISCTSVDKAKEYAQQRPFSLIITDIMIPGMLGHEFIQYTRSIGRIEPMMFVTGNATREVLLAAVRLGIYDVIEKPFNEKDLLSSVERIIEIDKRKSSLNETSNTEEKSIESTYLNKKIIGLLHAITAKKAM